MRVKHIPAEKEISLWETIFGVPPSVKFEDAIFAFPAMFVLLLITYFVLVLFSSLRQRKEQKNKIALLQKLRDEEKAKGGNVVEEEILMGRGNIKSSTDYLEATGASKGREDFQKELESKSAPVMEGQIKKEENPAPAAVQKPAAAPAAPATPPAAPAKPPAVPAPAAPVTPPAAPAKPPAVPAPAAPVTPPAAPAKPAAPAVPKPPAPPQG